MGGLGPHAHIAFESQLLAACEAAVDQDYPPWILSSLPATPDRTAAILEGAESPLPQLVASLKNLEGRADFALTVCNTAHAFLEEAAAQVRLPVLHLIRETVMALDRQLPAEETAPTIGLLATTGTLRLGIYPETAAIDAPRLAWRSPLDLVDGDPVQSQLVMEPIYGVKAGGKANSDGVTYADQLASAAQRLFDSGCDAVVLGCTEISVALGARTQDDQRLVDPLQIAAQRCLQIAAGDAPLPE